MHDLIKLLATAALGFTGLLNAADLASFKTAAAGFTLDDTGALTAITRLADGRNYLPAGQPAPVLQVRVGGKLHAPERAAWDAAAQQLTLRYSAIGAEAVIRINAKLSHVSLEVVAATPLDRIELVQWGPYPTSIGDIIGEVVGVVRDPEFAIGIQALNPKTLGGAAGPENDIEFSENTIDQAIAATQRAGLKSLYHSGLFETWGHFQLFLTNAGLAMEMAGTIAKLCNHADIRQISMDGLEGNLTPSLTLTIR